MSIAGCCFFYVITRHNNIIGIYSSIVARVGLRNTYFLGCWVNALVMLLLPHAAKLTGSPQSAGTWILLSTALSLQSTSMMWTLTSVFVFINNSCYSHQRGTVNGIGQSLSSLGRMIGPVVFSFIFAWSENNQLQWPLNYYVSFYLIFFLSIANAQLSRYLPKSIQR